MICKRLYNESHIRLTDNGSFGYCCKMQMPLDDKQRHNDIIKEIEQGLKPAECNACWDVEEKGLDSYRQKGLREVKDNLYFVGINLDRTCNLACAYCCATLSSSWWQETLHLRDKKDTVYHDTLDAFKATDHTITDKQSEEIILNTIKKVLDRIAIEKEKQIEFIQKVLHINLLGGEPLLSRFIKKEGILKIASFIEDYVNTSNLILNTDFTVEMSFTTNGSVPTSILERTLKELEQVKNNRIVTKVYFTISNEAVGLTSDYVRYGSDWNTFVVNVEKMLLADTIDRISFIMTINSIGITKITDYIEFVINITKKYNRPKNLIFNPVYEPYELAISVLDESFLKYIDNGVKCLEENNFPLDVIHSLAILRNNIGKDTKNKSKLKLMIDYYTLYRNLDLKIIEPEIYNYAMKEN